MTAQPPTATAATGETAAQEWWVQRWVDLLNTYRFKKRLERGRIYAREGNILSLEFRNGKVHAKVQGTAPEPYNLTIFIERFSDEDWRFVVASMAQKAIYSAKLLAGTMPDDIETVFTSNGLSLFPFTLADVRSRCNCPDPKNPCKHIAAVYYQLGDFFREDPFVLFQLRGRTKTEILEAIRYQRSGKTPVVTPVTDRAILPVESETRMGDDDFSNASSAQETAIGDLDATDDSTVAAVVPELELEPGPNSKPESEDGTSAVVSDTADVWTVPIDFNLAEFWHYDYPLDPSLVVITPPNSSQTVLDVLGKLPLAPNDAQTIRQYLDTVYQAVSQQAMMTALNRNV